MTAKEAFSGIRKVENYYGMNFYPKDLAPIWPFLLQQPAEAMARAVGEMKMIWKRPPTAQDLLAAVKRAAEKLDRVVVDDSVAEGQAVFNLMNGFLSGQISEPELIKGLYAMASVYGKPEYAADAQAREERLKGECA